MIVILSNHHYLLSTSKVPESPSSGVATVKHLPPFPSSASPPSTPAHSTASFAAYTNFLFALPADVLHASSYLSIVWLMSLEAIL